MDDHKEQPSEEDIPSDFFDDFNKDEFIQGLSVIDSWDDDDQSSRRKAAVAAAEQKQQRRITSEALDNIKDLRECIVEKNPPSIKDLRECIVEKNPPSIKDLRECIVEKNPPSTKDLRECIVEKNPPSTKDLRECIVEKKPPSIKDLRECIVEKKPPSAVKEQDMSQQPVDEAPKRSSSASRLDSYILPGSRRDPTKTIEAIKRDKEIKMKQHLTKKLESNDDIRPPGTELDDFFENNKTTEKKCPEKAEEKPPSKSRPWQNSPPRRKYPQHDRRDLLRSSPQKRSPYRRSPPRHMHNRYSPHRRSPHRRSPHRRSPRRSPQRSWRYSPQKKFRKFNRSSPYRQNRERSPGRHYGSRRSRSRSPRPRDEFLYPNPSAQQIYKPNSTEDPYRNVQRQQYTAPAPVEYPVTPTDYTYQQGQVYPGYTVNYDYGSQPAPSNMVPVPQPVPAPGVAPPLNIKPGPVMVPPPLMVATTMQPPTQPLPMTIPIPNMNDRLAQLVAEGKLTHEDYLKLTPNKGSVPSPDNQAKMAVLKRCNQAISGLDKLALPTRLLINNSVIGVEQRCLAPKFCSPLKRHAMVEFQFTKASVSATAQQNKQIIDNIIAAIGLEKTFIKKKPTKNVKDASVQTFQSFCEACEIRNTTKSYDAATFTQPEYFSSSVHTQVVEQDLISSKSVFNPTGSANNPTMSIAHLTPAQLVSQLAARAKTLKQSPDPGQYGRQDPSNYDPRGPPARLYHENYSNYRY